MILYIQLFFCFVQVGLLSIGGGYAAMPIIQSQVVDKYGWITISEFTDLITIAEMTPGPIAVNSATFVGIRVLGLPGAVVATMGCILPSCILVTCLAGIYYKYKSMNSMQTILSMLRPVVVALIASAGLIILLNVLFSSKEILLQNMDLASLILFLGAFLSIRFFHFKPIKTMFLCGILYAGIFSLIRMGS